MKTISRAVCLMSLFLLISCSSKVGYSVVLWEIPEYGLEDGDIVPVYLKSNVTHTYAIGLPSDEKQKVEIPLWQLTEPSSKRNAEKTALRFADYRYQYASVTLDGLPVRSEPVNISRQVYRLKKDEIIKVLYKGVGQPVMLGDTPVEGDWLRVMSNDGTQGWCFSYNLRVYSVHDEISPDEMLAQIEEQTDEILKTILSRKWYPEIYESLILNNTIDLERINIDYGFSIDAGNKSLKLVLPEFEKESSYTDTIKNNDGSYAFEGSSVTVVPRLMGKPEARLIVVIVTDERGMPTANNFIAIDEPVERIIAAEKTRRQNIFRSIRSFGPSFTSANYGTMQFGENNAFTWQNFSLLSPAIIPSNAGNAGTVEFKYFISRQLSAEFDGVITLNFTNVNREINFFYKMESAGLRLEDASGVVPQSNVFMSRGPGSVVAFFSRQ